MALHTRAEICTLTGLKSNELSVYIKRKKLVFNGDYVDDKVEPNTSFIKKFKDRLVGSGGDIFEAPPEKIKPISKPKEDTPPPPAPSVKAVKTKKEEDDDGIYGLEKQQKALSIEKTRKENELLDVKIAKAHGDNVPTDLVKPLFAQHSKSMTAAFYNAADVLLARIAQKYKLTQEDVAKYRGDLVAIINQAIADSIDESKESLKSIIDEYSERRGVGEKN